MPTKKMKERLAKTEQFLSEQGFVNVYDIAEHLGVSESTVRRDISYLADNNSVVKNYGFVALTDQLSNIYDNPMLRKNMNIQVKAALGEQAARLVEDGDVIYIESGTTLVHMAKKITAKNVTAVTSDLYIALELSKLKNVTTVSTGGHVWSETAVMVGDIAVTTLGKMHFSKCFTSPGGIRADGCVTYFNIQASDVRQKVFSVSKQIIVVAEKKKFGREAFVHDLSLNQVSVLIADEVPGKMGGRFPKKLKQIITAV